MKERLETAAGVLIVAGFCLAVMLLLELFVAPLPLI